MQSAFTPPRPRPGVTANPAVEETYDLAGLNLKDPDEIMPAGESPWTINSRMYARNDQESRVANRTRKGASYLSTPVGEALNVVNTASNTGDVEFSVTTAVAQPFTPNASGPMSRLDLKIKKDASGSTGHVIVEIRADNSGLPGTDIIAQSSILNSSITTSYQYLPVYLIDTPALISGTQYWIYVYTQDNGSGNYYLDQTAATGAYSTTDGAVSFTTLGHSFNFKTYLSTSGTIRGFTTRYPSDPTKNLIIFAQGDKIYSVPKTGGVPTVIDSGLDNSSKPVRFAQFNDKTIWVNGANNARWWDGTNPATDIGGGAPNNTAPFDVMVWQNRVFLMSANNRVDFSDLNDPISYTSTNFFYVPAPLSPDHMTGWRIFQDRLVIFTHETKHIIIGSDISTFTRKEAVGTKGAVSQEAMDADRNFVYFMADDKQVYAYNGATDALLSEKLQPEFQSISDVSKVRIHVYRNQVRVYYPKSPSSTNNRMALYDLELKQWFLDTDHPVSGSAELYLDDNELVEFHAVVGQVMFGETQFSDLGKKIDWKFWTPYKTYAYRRRTGQTFGGGSAKKRIKRFRPVVRITEAPFNMLVGKDMDFANDPDMRIYSVSGTGAVWGGWVYGDGTKYGTTRQIQNRAGMSGRGQYIQYRFERSGVETPVELYGYIAMYKVGRQK